MRDRKRSSQGHGIKSGQIYELEVCLLSGQITEKFAEQNPIVSRTIEIRGDQTLTILHQAIFEAFGRFDQHMYEFQIGGKGPMDPKARRYVFSGAFSDPIPGTPKPAGDVTRTSINSLGLKVDQAFAYWFDFGDDWWHQINVLAIKDKTPRGKYPKVTNRVGESPPQYVDWDEEE